MAFKMNTGFLSFRIKAIVKEPKKEKKPSSISLITGIIVKDDKYDYLVKVKAIDENNNVDEKLYQLTEESYNLYDKTVIYSRKKYKRGYNCIIKTHNDAKLYFNGINPFYVPFRPGLKVKGKLVNNNGIKFFNIVEVCNPESYISY